MFRVAPRRFVVVLVVAFICAAMDRPSRADPIDVLNEKYQTGSLYITYATLLDISLTINDPDRFPELVKITPAITPELRDEAFKTLKAFFQRISDGAGDGHRDNRIAIVQVDWRDDFAGYMLLSNPGGSMQKINWGRDVIRQVALIFDKYITQFVWSQQSEEEIKSGKVDLVKAFEIVKQAQETPYLPERVQSRLAVGFREMLEQQPDQFNALIDDDPEAFQAIKSFKSSHDDTLKDAEMKIIDTVPEYRQYLKDPSAGLDLRDWNSIMAHKDRAIVHSARKSFGIAGQAVTPDAKPGKADTDPLPRLIEMRRPKDEVIDFGVPEGFRVNPGPL
jgi:hypothetical protein